MAGARLLEEFPPVTTEQWEEAIRKDLKGADYAKKLLWQTEEGITVKPYYRAEDVAGIETLDALPGEFPYVRGARTSNDWRLRETIEAATVEEATRRAAMALAAGAGEIEFVVGGRGLTLRGPDSVAALVMDLRCPVHFAAGENAGAVLKLLIDARPGIEGSIDYDPLGEGAPAAAAVELVRAALAGLPRFRPVTVRAHRFHDAGATATQELGFALAAGVEYLAAFTERRLRVDDAASSLAFSFAAGSNFFFEIAKLRAARMLWARAVQAFQPARAESAQARLHSRTSRWNKAIYDPHVNILRAATEAMSAAMGGCDSLSVAPFDETHRYADDFSRRLARNTQLILKKEAWLDRVVDPAGGSWYVEALTDSIASESWRILQEIEGAGGYRKAWDSGLIPGLLVSSREAKLAAVRSRRRTIVGTNQYPNFKERMLGRIERPPQERYPPRGAEPFETIRLRTEQHGRAPVFLLIEMGDLTMRKARSAFSANFFGCAGFEIRTGFAPDIDAALRAVEEHRPDAVVLCSSDEEYPGIAGPLCRRLREVPVIVAGYPKDSAPVLMEAGVADFVHLRSNAAEVLSAWQTRLGIRE